MQVTGMQEIAAKLAQYPVKLEAALLPAAKEGAELVEHKAEANASFSSDIPSHISSKATAGVRGVSAVVTVAEFGYPHRGKAHVFEGNGESPEEFLASNWGRDDGHVMSSHPYLGPAAEEEEDEVRALFAAAARKAFD
jgi:hypothetical protein